MTLDQNTLKMVIDEAFAVAEQLEAGHPIVVAVLRSANQLIDDLVPQLAPRLQARGLVIHQGKPTGEAVPPLTPPLDPNLPKPTPPPHGRPGH